jgi:Pyruvate/2-oxoacid:ferredoxin oxidoreductase delta subunit
MNKDKQLKKANFYKKFFPKKIPRYNPAKLKFIARIIEKKYLEGDELFCLPNDHVINIGKKVEKEADTILPSKVVEHFIEKSSYRFVMHKCICRECMPCKTYPHEIGCLFLGEPARDIHPELGRELTVAEALAHVRKATENGLVFSVGKSKLDTVWLDIGPGDRLFTICMCCPCCCITRGLVKGHPLLGRNYNRMPGLQMVVTDDCTGCGACTKEGVCIFDGIRMEGDAARINDNCKGCGRCAGECPNQAIQAVIESRDYVNRTIERLNWKIDVT